MAEQGVDERALAPSVRALFAVVDEVTPAGGEQESRRRQLRMVAGMWGRAVGSEVMPAAAARSVAALFGQEAVDVFWGMAVAGELRVREEDRGRPLPVASQRIVRDCLGILAGRVVPGRVPVLPEVSQQEPLSVVSRKQLLVVYRKLVDLAGAGPLEREGTGLSLEDRTRLLAMVAVVLDTGARSGEMEAHRLDDLVEGGGALRSVRRSQNVGRLPEAVWVWPLRPGTQAALERWLRVREGLVADVEGARDALWVSLKSNQWQQERGLPLRAQGIRKAYTRGAVALNWVMAGRRGWEPLPLRFEALGRTARAELGVVPHGRGVRGRALGREVPQDAGAVVRELLAGPWMPVREIAAAAGVSVGTLYQRFPEVRRRSGG